ncbi:MAG TPA: hypothetical protein VGQ59_03580 [Cyclobacteriaceae bacterium]|jgi:hypothetical protein|nr:hypothetical protein [Cyclobacteriaceae bacterium]
MKIKLAYFNLVLTVGYFGIEIVVGSVNFILAIGSIAILWYNWETIKRLKGQPSQLNKVNILFGVAVLLFSALLTAEGFYKIIQNQATELAMTVLLLGLVQIAIGFGNLLLTAKTIRIYSKKLIA